MENFDVVIFAEAKKKNKIKNKKTNNRTLS